MKNNRLSKAILVLTSLTLVFGFSLFILEKFKIINLYTKPSNPIAANTSRPVNDVAYTPATTPEQNEGNQIKQNIIDESNKKPTNPGTISVSLSAAGQDNPGGPLIVRAMISGTNSGTCNLSLTQGSAIKKYSAKVVNLGTYYGCEGFSVPFSDISVGKWQLNLAVDNGTINGNTSQEVQITQ